MQTDWAGQLSDLTKLSEPAAEPAGGPSGFDDEVLIARIRESGSQAHFRLLIERHKDHVFGLVASVLGPRHEQLIDEVAQDVFIKIHKRLGAFRGESRFATWAYRIAYNTAIDHLRSIQRRERREFPDVSETSSSAARGPQEELVAAERADRVQRAMEHLPDLYRTLIHLHYWRGMTVADMAEMLDSRPGTIKSYLYRARARLETRLGDLA